jgi:hypothetical protein
VTCLVFQNPPTLLTSTSTREALQDLGGHRPHL